MTEESGDSAPANEQAATSAPVEGETSTPETVTTEPGAETTEAAEAAETGEPKEDESSTEDKPRKLSRSERMRRRMQAMATELDSLRAQMSMNGNQDGQVSGKDAPPKEEDFNGDYFAYQRALTAYEVTQALRNEIDGERKRTQAEISAQRQREAEEDFLERAEEVKALVPDFDATVAAFANAGGQFSKALVEELHDSEVGPMLVYQLAKNPQKVAELNAMSPRDIAREIGRLEAKTSLPKPRKQTQAPSPVKPLQGGSAAPRDIHALAKSDDISAFVKAREEQERARRR